jgi:hypothetical protein
MRLALIALLLTGLAIPAAAHHGWGSYDADNPVTIEGAIEDIALQNPHGEMFLPYQDEIWLVTLAPLSRMNARGATEDVLQPGVMVTAYGYPRRDGTPEIRAEWVEVDGQRFQLR